MNGTFYLVAALAMSAVVPARGDPPDAAPTAMPVHPDPYLPPGKRHLAPEPGAAGEDLRKQALQKLKQRFDEADLDHNGSLTLDEARAGGLGFVVKHFARIDANGRGQVSFADLASYLQQRRDEASAR